MIGVYILFKNKKIVYIGQTESWPSRLAGHRIIEFDEAKLFECAASDLLKNEARLIRILRPKYNVQNIKANRTGKRLLKNDWVIKNYQLLAPLVKKYRNGWDKDAEELSELIKNVREELKYSPTTTATDIWWTLRNRFESLNKKEILSST